MPAVADRVQPENLRVLVLGLDELVEQRGKRRPSRVVERRRVVHRRRRVKHAQRGVEVVELVVDQAQRHHLPSEHGRQLLGRREVGPEPVAGQHGAVPGDEDVPLALVHVLGLVHGRPAVPAEPVHVRGRLGRALGVAEAHAEHGGVDHGGAVRREHHVGQPRDRLDDRDGVPERLIGLPQGLPLPQRQRRIDGGVRPHPRVDRVRHGEVLGRAHQVGPGRGDPAGHVVAHAPSVGSAATLVTERGYASEWRSVAYFRHRQSIRCAAVGNVGHVTLAARRCPLLPVAGRPAAGRRRRRRFHRAAPGNAPEH